MTELAEGGPPTTDDRSSGGVPPDESDPPVEGLAFDEMMLGLTLDEVSVVLVADRPVLVPLSAELAERSGFTVLGVSDESLLSLGILPRRPPVEIVDLVPSPDSAPPDAAHSADDGNAAADASAEMTPSPDVAANPGTGSWATWPTSVPEAKASMAASRSGQPTNPNLSSMLTPTSPPIPGRSSSSSDPLSQAPSGGQSTPFAPSLTEAPVETARPINAMAASHLDWEPDALGWPYIDRRLEMLPTDPTGASESPAPRSLTSGRPVNLADAVDLVVSGEAVDETDLIIELRDAATVSLASITIDIAATSLTVVSGPRGSGKTSLLRLLAGFDALTNGTGLVGGERVELIHPDDRAAREAISAGFIPQLPFLVPDLTVAENVELPLLASDVSPAMARGAAAETLRMVGLGSVIGLPAAVLSGGEVRLAAVARALVSSPEIVFADEPFAGLSDDDAAMVLACLHDVVADGGTVILACTDPRIRLHGVRQLLLDRGTVVRDDVASSTN